MIAAIAESSSIPLSPLERSDDPARIALLEELQRLAVETYGEDRAAEASLQSALSLAATALWRVDQEPLDPGGIEP
ncbi:MAG: hypothetical protein JO157_14490 [Acetobacteraceae bacterium]|nr:hypothetical protein [Acetobacteraceae bacterium]